MTACDRLHTFNFQAATTAGTTGVDVEAMSREELQKYTKTVLRFLPVEVAMRYFPHDLQVGGMQAKLEGGVNGSRNSGAHGVGDGVPSGYSQLKRHMKPLREQGYEHHMEAAVLFSDISGFTKLTNRLLAERGQEGAEILNGAAAVRSPPRPFRPLAQSTTCSLAQVDSPVVLA